MTDEEAHGLTSPEVTPLLREARRNHGRLQRGATFSSDSDGSTGNSDSDESTGSSSEFEERREPVSKLVVAALSFSFVVAFLSVYYYSQMSADAAPPSAALEAVVQPSLDHRSKYLCAKLGCNSPYRSWKPCQCNEDCTKYGNCCSDYSAICDAKADSCKQIGCHTTVWSGRQCQCRPECYGYGNCCSDYEKTCSGMESCARLGCNTKFERHRSCQCNAQCHDFGNCCSDYKTLCDMHKTRCAKVGCDTPYQQDRSCQCNSECVHHETCCSDYADFCSSKAPNFCRYLNLFGILGYWCPTKPEIPTPAPPPLTPVPTSTASPTLAPTSPRTLAPTLAPTVFSCSTVGCNVPYSHQNPCQCNPNCAQHLSCCRDYGSVCVPLTPTPTVRPTARPTPFPTLAPTIRPTVRPTPSPTLAPTMSPTKPPTPTPTAAATRSPTFSPTERHTEPEVLLDPMTVPTRSPSSVTITPSYRSSDHTVIKGIAYGPSPETHRGVLLPNDDFMSTQAAQQWAPWGRGDLAIMRSLGANTVRLYGNDPTQHHKPFLDEAHKNGLGVIAGMSDWPYLQMPGNCKETAHDCFTQIYASYKQNLFTGFTVEAGDGNRLYHPALRAMIIINEPEIGKFDRARSIQCKVVASAFDAMLKAEEDSGVTGNMIAYTVTYSYASFYGQSAIGQMELLYACMKNPLKVGGYTPRLDITSAYLARFVNGFNTYSPATGIRVQFLKKYASAGFWKGDNRIPVFIGEYHAPNAAQEDDLPLMLRSTSDARYPFFLGFCFFEFQARYDKAENAEHEMSFGLFGLDAKCDMGRMDFFGESYHVFSLSPRRDIRGVEMAYALASAFSGDYESMDLSCKEAIAPSNWSLQTQFTKKEGIVYMVSTTRTTTISTTFDYATTQRPAPLQRPPSSRPAPWPARKPSSQKPTSRRRWRSRSIRRRHRPRRPRRRRRRKPRRPRRR